MTAHRVLALLCAVMVLAMAPWFSASAVAPALAARWGLGPAETAWLTVSVQLGFVLGALGSALLTLSDRWSARRVVAVAAALAGTATLGVAAAPGAPAAVALRFVTGAALACVYPPGMKIAAGWFREGRGTAVGILVGAVTLGTAGPHLVRWVVPAEHWRWVLLTAAGSAFAGSLLILRVPHDGPYAVRAATFSWGAIPRILRDRATLLANGGYLGHMWELYALWTWVALWITESEAVRTGGGAGAVGAAGALVALGVIGSGALGCWLGGVAADRWGRTGVTSVAMAISGGCAALAGLLFGRPLAVMLPLLLVWGISVVADSAQFSTAVSELAPPDLVGSALTLQTCLGFLLTTASIYLLPALARQMGWRWVMVALVPGPALGVASMLALRRRPEAVRLAGGRR